VAFIADNKDAAKILIETDLPLAVHLIQLAETADLSYKHVL